MTDQDDPLMVGAWMWFVSWAIDDPSMRERFERDTGIKFSSPPKTAIDAAIDDATGKTESDVRNFVFWVTEHYWGIDDAPRKLRTAMIGEVDD